MSLVILFILEILLFLIIIWGLGFLWETHLNGKLNRVIYHASNLREQGPLLRDIITRYGIKTEKVALIEPGAGMALVSHYLTKFFSWRSVEAVELGPYILWLGRLRFLFRPNQVHWIQQDLLKYNYSPGSVVYCYLFPSLITRLYKEGKLKECLVISLTFLIEDCQPTEEIKLKSWQGRLLVYDFRKAGDDKAVKS